MRNALANILLTLAYWLAPALKPAVPAPDRAGGGGEER